MTRWFYVGGAVRIVVLQQNSLKTRRSTVAPTGACVMSASRAAHGSDVTRGQTGRLEGSRTKDSGG